MNACGRKNAKTRPRILFSSAYNIIKYLRSDQQLHPPLLAHLACSVINLQDFHVSNLLPVTLSIHLSAYRYFQPFGPKTKYGVRCDILPILFFNLFKVLTDSFEKLGLLNLLH